VLSGVLRRIARSARSALVSPPVAGLAYVVGLSAWSGRRSSGVAVEVGDVRRAAAVETFIARRFPADVTRMKVGVVATAVALGLVVGLVAELLLRLRHPARAIVRRSAAVALAEATLLVAGLHGALVAWAMADTPQLYAESWYAQGGLARTTQVILTDILGPRGVVLAAFALALLYIRPARLAYLARRGIGAARRSFRLVFARLAKGSVLAIVALSIAAAALADAPRAVSVAHAAAGSATAAPAEATAKAMATSAATATKDDKPVNVLILAADSLRADRLDPRVAPNLMKLAARGTRFDRAYVSLPRTFPSWVTILTGRHAHHHGVRSMFPTWEERAKDFDALPGRFARAGYSTAVVSDYAGDIFSRIDLGFARVDTPSFDFRQIIRQKALERETPLLPILHSHLGRRLFPVMRELSSAADPNLLADDAENVLRSLRSNPFFVTVFFSSAHFPYAAPAPYYSKYTNKSYRGRFKYHKPLGLGMANEVAPDAEDVRQIQGLYDGTVAGIDDAMGRVLATLERLGLAERTIVVITADHGESLFDNGHGQGHGDHLFGDEGTHVPLVVYDPRVGGRGDGKAPSAGDKRIAAEGHREGRLARDVDLAPTLYELAGITPPSDLDGRSLVPALRGEALEPRFAYAETELWFTEEIPGLAPELRIPYPGVMGLTEIDSRHNTEIVLRKDMQAPTLMARHRMVRDERYKLVYVPTRASVRYMLFDTETDPAELHDVAATHPNEVARLRAELWAWMLEDSAMEQKGGYLVPTQRSERVTQGMDRVEGAR
jgi:arylsulfatase A-like enzyme